MDDDYRLSCPICKKLGKYSLPVQIPNIRINDPKHLSERRYRCEHCGSHIDQEKPESYWRAVDAIYPPSRLSGQDLDGNPGEIDPTL